MLKYVLNCRCVSGEIGYINISLWECSKDIQLISFNLHVPDRVSMNNIRELIKVVNEKLNEIAGYEGCRKFMNECFKNEGPHLFEKCFGRWKIRENYKKFMEKHMNCTGGEKDMKDKFEEILYQLRAFREEMYYVYEALERKVRKLEEDISGK